MGRHQRSVRPVFYIRDQNRDWDWDEKNQSHKKRLRPRLKSFGLKRQGQYLDLWYTVLIFETKTKMSLKRHNLSLDVRTNAETLVDLCSEAELKKRTHIAVTKLWSGHIHIYESYESFWKLSKIQPNDRWINLAVGDLSPVHKKKMKNFFLFNLLTS